MPGGVCVHTHRLKGGGAGELIHLFFALKTDENMYPQNQGGRQQYLAKRITTLRPVAGSVNAFFLKMIRSPS